MRQAFEVLKSSQFQKDMVDYAIRINEQRPLVVKFLNKYKIKATKYYVYGESDKKNQPYANNEKNLISLYIKGEKKEQVKNVANQLCMDTQCGMRRFKKGSDIALAFSRYCIRNNIIVNLTHPNLSDYFKELKGKSFTYTCVTEGNTIYIEFFPDTPELETPLGFKAIDVRTFRIINNRVIGGNYELQRNY